MAAEVKSFLKTILRSGLLDQEQLEAILRRVPPDLRKDAETLAEHLVKTGTLSRFQAHKLLRGTALGLVLGPFQVLAPIGRGGMSTVYLARDTRSQLLLALKVLPPKRAREEDRVLARFRREMEMCQRVAHPHIAWTYEVGVYRGVYYIAMEYIPGRSLRRLVSEKGPLSVSHAARLFAEVAAALDHAHTQGLIHRDLKPSNILITPHDHAKVLDLGLAMVQGEEGADRQVVGGQGYVVGTMDYIAPEQTEDAAAVDPRSDVYALGCSLYYALTGQPPFPGGTSREKIHRQRTEEPVPLTELVPSIPPDFAALVARMMAKRPEERIATAAEVRQELLAYAQGEPVQPLDRQDDQEYQQAVTALETTEADSGLTAELPPVEPPQAEDWPAGKLSALLPPLPALPGEETTLLPGQLLLVILGAFLTGSVLLVGVFYLLLR